MDTTATKQDTDRARLDAYRAAYTDLCQELFKTFGTGADSMAASLIWTANEKTGGDAMTVIADDLAERNRARNEGQASS